MLNNKLVQVILESESEVVMKERKEAKHKSILDLFWFLLKYLKE